MDERGVAPFLIKGILALVIFGIMWYTFNLVIYGEVGIGTQLENEIANPQIKQTTQTYTWFWNVVPIVAIIAIAVYMIYGAMVREPIALEG